jgi:hypothetical protein
VTHRTARRFALSVLGSSLVLLAVAVFLGVPTSMAPLVAPVVIALASSVLALLAIRSRARAAAGPPD